MVTLFHRYIFCVALLCVAVCGAAQKATVERMEMLPMDLSASKYPRFDNNGDPCALVRVEVIADGVDFFGNVLKPVEHKMGEYWVYMLAGSKMLQIKSDAFLPLMVNFADYGVTPLQPKATYVITLSLPAATAPQPSSAPTAEYSEDVDYKPFKGDNGKCGFKDKNGNIVIPAKYDDLIYGFSEGLAPAAINGKWGFIDINGNFVIAPQYENFHLFHFGQNEVKKNDKWGKIDRRGNVIIPFKYDFIGKLSDGLSYIVLDDKWGFVDQAGSFVIPFTYDWAKHFTEGLAPVVIKGKWGFIDKTGKLVIPAKYLSAENFSEGLAAVEVKNRKWGYIDTKGKLVIPASYQKANDFSEGLACVLIKWKYGYIDKKGELVIPAKYDVATRFEEGTAWVELDGRNFKIDKNGNEVK